MKTVTLLKIDRIAILIIEYQRLQNINSPIDLCTDRQFLLFTLTSSEDSCIESAKLFIKQSLSLPGNKLVWRPCAVSYFYSIKWLKYLFLKYFLKSIRPLCIDYELQLVFFQQAPLNLWGNIYITIIEITYNKMTKLHTIMNDQFSFNSIWLQDRPKLRQPVLARISQPKTSRKAIWVYSVIWYLPLNLLNKL